MDIFNSALARILDIVFYPIRNLNSWVAMVLVSLVTALFMLLAYRLTSNQEKIRAAKGKIMAHLLEVRLYKDSLPVSLKAQGNVLWYNLKYLTQSLRTMLILIIPMVLILIHLDQRFGYEPLRIGESTLITVRLKEGHRPSVERVEIRPSTSFVVETPPLRMEPEGEVDWRLHATEPGTKELVIVVDHQEVSKQVIVGKRAFSKISSVKTGGNWLSRLANPGEPEISESVPVKSIEVRYSSRSMTFFGWRIHWLVAFFILSVVFAFGLKGLFKVEI
jgi:hypothetical protein